MIWHDGFWIAWSAWAFLRNVKMARSLPLTLLWALNAVCWFGLMVYHLLKR